MKPTPLTYFAARESVHVRADALGDAKCVGIASRYLLFANRSLILRTRFRAAYYLSLLIEFSLSFSFCFVSPTSFLYHASRPIPKRICVCVCVLLLSGALSQKSSFVADLRSDVVRATEKMYECEREKESVLGEADGVDDSSFVRWTKNIFLSYRALEGLSWNGREGVRRREEVREVRFKEGRDSEYMYVYRSVSKGRESEKESVGRRRRKCTNTYITRGRYTGCSRTRDFDFNQILQPQFTIYSCIIIKMSTHWKLAAIKMENVKVD